MEDSRIVDLYWQRNESAIDATAQKYGSYCLRIASNILSSREDAEESVNDTYLSAWQSIPPYRPSVLSTFLGKITRRISLNRWRNQHRQKRGGGEIPLVLEELAQCIPSGQSLEQHLEQKELTQAIRRFLGTLPETQRDVFVSRYWFLADIPEIAGKFGFTQGKVKSMLFRLRERLRDYLLKEGLI